MTTSVPYAIATPKIKLNLFFYFFIFYKAFEIQ